MHTSNLVLSRASVANSSYVLPRFSKWETVYHAHNKNVPTHFNGAVNYIFYTRLSTKSRDHVTFLHF